MTTLALRQKLAEYIHFADEKKIKAIYNLLEDNINQKNNVWTKDFVVEMTSRNKDMNEAKVKGKSKAEVFSKAKSVIKKVNASK